MKKTIFSYTIAAGLALAATGLAGCAKNGARGEGCAGGGEACRQKEASGSKCCGKCPGPEADVGRPSGMGE